MNNKYYNKFYWISKQIESTSCGFILAIFESNEWVINHVLQVGVIMATYVSSHLKVFHEIGVLENFKKFTEKHVSQSLFNKVALKLLNRHSPKDICVWAIKPCKCLGRSIMLG